MEIHNKTLFKNKIKLVIPVSCYYHMVIMGGLFMSTLCCQFQAYCCSSFSRCSFLSPLTPFTTMILLQRPQSFDLTFEGYVHVLSGGHYFQACITEITCITQVLTGIIHIALLIYKGGLSSLALISSLIFLLLYTRLIFYFPNIFPLSIPASS